MADFGIYPYAIVSIKIEANTQAYWNAYNPIIKLREGAFANDTGILKIGNGQQRYRDLVAFEAEIYTPKHAYQHGINGKDPITPTAINAADRDHVHNSSQITDLQQTIKYTIENDTTVHTDADTVAGSNPSVVPISNSVAIRTPTGTIKTATPREDDDAARAVDLNNSVSILRNELNTAITTEHAYTNTAINNIATALRNEKGIANGYASLNNNGKVPISQLPYVVQTLYDPTTNALILLTVGNN